jgi:hypothetical protein
MVANIMNNEKIVGATVDVMVPLLGDKGRHARTTVAVAVLPLDAAVEVGGIFEIS